MSLTILFVALTFAHTARTAFVPPSIPLNWTTLSPCAVDNPARILADDVTTVVPDDNTPASCITSCAALGFGYAGVEFGDECHCGTGLKAPLDDGPAAVCDMACTGDPTLACGGAWSIQVRTALLSFRVLLQDSFDGMNAGVYGPRLASRELGIPGLYRRHGRDASVQHLRAADHPVQPRPREPMSSSVCARRVFVRGGGERERLPLQQ